MEDLVKHQSTWEEAGKKISLIKVTRDAKTMFVKETGVFKTWEEAATKLPEFANTSRLEPLLADVKKSKSNVVPPKMKVKSLYSQYT